MNTLSPAVEASIDLNLSADDRRELQKDTTALGVQLEHSALPDRATRELSDISLQGDVMQNLKKVVGSQFTKMTFTTEEQEGSLFETKIRLFGDSSTRPVELRAPAEDYFIDDSSRFSIHPYLSNRSIGTMPLDDTALLIDGLVLADHQVAAVADPRTGNSYPEVIRGIQEQLRRFSRHQTTELVFEETESTESQVPDVAAPEFFIQQEATIAIRKDQQTTYCLQLAAPMLVGKAIVWSTFKYEFQRPKHDTSVDRATYVIGSDQLGMSSIRALLKNRQAADGAALGRRALELMGKRLAA